MDRFAQLETFVRVVETGSITRAAERLGVAKSAVSRRLAELEERLHVQLFRRTTRRLNLTDTGRGFFERSMQILTDMDEAEGSVTREHAELRGRLRVAAPLTFGLLHLSPAICEFGAAHPAVNFDLDFNDRQVDLVQEGFDVAIRIAQLSDSSLIARRLATIRSSVCASPAYLAAHGVPDHPRELATHACLIYSNLPSPEIWHYRERDGVAGTVHVNVAVSANNGDFLRAVARDGHGIALEPNFIVHEDLANGSLVAILRDYGWPQVNAYAVYPPTRHLSRRVRAFVDFLAQRFSGTPYWESVPGGDSTGFDGET